MVIHKYKSKEVKVDFNQETLKIVFKNIRLSFDDYSQTCNHIGSLHIDNFKKQDDHFLKITKHDFLLKYLIDIQNEQAISYKKNSIVNESRHEYYNSIVRV